MGETNWLDCGALLVTGHGHSITVRIRAIFMLLEDFLVLMLPFSIIMHAPQPLKATDKALQTSRNGYLPLASIHLPGSDLVPSIGLDRTDPHSGPARSADRTCSPHSL